MNLLSSVLEDPHCKLEKLRLYNCGITDEGCAALASALRSNPSHLRELNLSGNKLGDSVKLLSDVLQNPHCKLEKLSGVPPLGKEYHDARTCFRFMHARNLCSEDERRFYGFGTT
uniref:Uncharacterized protein n=1 Tax=Sinocyclocheilus rhinocerous TaxID=307959 RepID=A0A673KZA0_9TELE